MLLSKELQDKIVNILVEDGLVDVVLVKKAYNEVSKTGQPILAVLKSKGIVSDDCVQHATAVATNTQYIDLRNIRFDRELLLNIPQEVAKRSKVIPLQVMNGQIS